MQAHESPPVYFLYLLVLLVTVSSVPVDIPKKRYPNAIIIGVKKSGTRALLEFLKINPKVKAPGPEIHFFDKHYDLGYEWYR
uniref:Sulfotransferase n=1 Tax=Panagrolaimus sp. JU765 TaxID=591449 RepID=A0AC34QSY2_9BILA